MRMLRFAGALVLSAAATFALAGPDQSAERALKAASASLEKGTDLLAASSKDRSNAARLDTLDRSLYFLRRARKQASGGAGASFDTVRADASQSLVHALDDQTEIYYRRKSLPMAQRRIDEALAIDPSDARARNLNTLVAAAQSSDVYSDNIGTVAYQRIHGRRAAIGVPLRDRGPGMRR